MNAAPRGRGLSECGSLLPLWRLAACRAPVFVNNASRSNVVDTRSFNKLHHSPPRHESRFVSPRRNHDQNRQTKRGRGHRLHG